MICTFSSSIHLILIRSPIIYDRIMQFNVNMGRDNNCLDPPICYLLQFFCFPPLLCLLLFFFRSVLFSWTPSLSLSRSISLSLSFSPFLPSISLSFPSSTYFHLAVFYPTSFEYIHFTLPQLFIFSWSIAFDKKKGLVRTFCFPSS